MAPYVAHHLSRSQGIQHLYESLPFACKSLTQQSLFCVQLDFLVYSLRVLSENALDARELRQIAGLLLLFHVLSCCERQAKNVVVNAQNHGCGLAVHLHTHTQAFM